MSLQHEFEDKYRIAQDYDGQFIIASVDELVNWIKERAADYDSYLRNHYDKDIEFSHDQLGGLYAVQDTLTFNEEMGVFTQEGTAPNYFGGVWSFATCRHMHRGHDSGNGGWNFDQFFQPHPTDNERLLPKHPTLIINAASSQRLAGQSRRPVANISFVTHGFWTVEAYAEFLLQEANERAISHRLTHDETPQAHQKALEFGDCHADRDGNVHEPPIGHDHHQGTESKCGCSTELHPHQDTATDHVKCTSLPGYWHAYSGTPKLEYRPIRDRGVRFIESWESLSEHLHPYEII